MRSISNSPWQWQNPSSANLKLLSLAVWHAALIFSPRLLCIAHRRVWLEIAMSGVKIFVCRRSQTPNRPPDNRSGASLGRDRAPSRSSRAEKNGKKESAGGEWAEARAGGGETQARRRSDGQARPTRKEIFNKTITAKLTINELRWHDPRLAALHLTSLVHLGIFFSEKI